MLGRLAQFNNGPIACGQLSAPQEVPIDIEKELKIGVEYICELNKKLNSLSWQAREIIQGWFRDGKSF